MEVFIFDQGDLRALSAAAERALNLHTQFSEQFFRRGKEITIDSEPDQPVWTDGEYQGRTPVSMKVIPGGLPVAVTE